MHAHSCTVAAGKHSRAHHVLLLLLTLALNHVPLDACQCNQVRLPKVMAARWCHNQQQCRNAAAWSCMQPKHAIRQAVYAHKDQAQSARLASAPGLK